MADLGALVVHAGNGKLRLPLASTQQNVRFKPNQRDSSNRFYTSTTNGTVNGIVKELNVAVAGKKMVAFDSRTNEYLGCAITAGDGSYSINCLGRNLVYVIGFDPPYNLLGLDRVIPGQFMYIVPAHGACDFNFHNSYIVPAHGSSNFNFGVDGIDGRRRFFIGVS